MIKRYTLKEMGDIWSEKNRYGTWLKVELAVCEAWNQLGIIPEDALKRIKEKADFSVDRIEEIEKEVKHDVIAFLTSVSEFVGQDSRFVHYGMTSYDVVDTALSLLIKQAIDLIKPKYKKLIDALKEKSIKYKELPQIGRTHGVHAEPVTFGLKFLIWKNEMERNYKRLEQAEKIISYGRIAGAVGTYAHITPKVEEIALKKLNLTPSLASTQVLQRDRHAEVLFALSVAATTLEKIAVEIRHLQRTEVLEAEEFFSKGQKGSSAMPHKRNPVNSERITGMARLLRGNLIAALENNALWHERDISHSSVERVIIPDSFIALDFMLNETIKLIEKLLVYPDKIEKNLNLTKGLIFSQKVLLALAEKGVKREDAYKMVQRNAMKSWQTGEEFKKLILDDSEVKNYLNEDEIENIFSINSFLKNINYIYEKNYNK
jgi:adenylosuccinate lyase